MAISVLMVEGSVDTTPFGRSPLSFFCPKALDRSMAEDDDAKSKDKAMTAENCMILVDTVTLDWMRLIKCRRVVLNTSDT